MVFRDVAYCVDLIEAHIAPIFTSGANNPVLFATDLYRETTDFAIRVVITQRQLYSISPNGESLLTVDLGHDPQDYPQLSMSVIPEWIDTLSDIVLRMNYKGSSRI